MAELLKNIPDEINELHLQVKMMLRAAVPENEIVSKLAEKEISEDYAQLIIASVQSEIADRKNFIKLLAVAGFILTGAFLLYAMAEPLPIKNSIGFVLIFWGLVVMGIITLIKAAGLYRNFPKYKQSGGQ